MQVRGKQEMGATPLQLFHYVDILPKTGVRIIPNHHSNQLKPQSGGEGGGGLPTFEHKMHLEKENFFLKNNIAFKGIF